MNTKAQVLQALELAGFTRARAASFLIDLDLTQSVADILDQVLARADEENRTDVGEKPSADVAEKSAASHASTNGEEPENSAGVKEPEPPPAVPPFAKKLNADFDVPKEASPDEASFEADDQEDEEEDLNLDLSDADAQELFAAASAELNHPKTLAQNRMLLSMLPEWLAALIREWMRFVQIPALLPTVCTLVTISAVLMKGLRCWSRKGWVYPNLYAVLGGRTGVGKSMVFEEAARPLKELDEELQLEFEELLSNLRADLGIIESTIKAKMAAHHQMVKGEKSKGVQPLTPATNWNASTSDPLPALFQSTQKLLAPGAQVISSGILEERLC